LQLTQSGASYYVECFGCGAETRWEDTPGEATENWNRREGPPEDADPLPSYRGRPVGDLAIRKIVSTLESDDRPHNARFLVLASLLAAERGPAGRGKCHELSELIDNFFYLDDPGPEDFGGCDFGAEVDGARP
jgi:hypothetical protein